MIDDPIKGFITKTIGFLPSEKVTKVSFSGTGDIFNVFELEGSRLSVSFYIITKEYQQPSQAQAIQPMGKGKSSAAQKTNKLQSQEEKYDFKKTAKHDVYETRFEDVWDETGRYLAIFG